MAEVDREREKTAERYVYLSELAKFIGRERSTFKRTLVAHGVAVHSIRNPVTGQINDALAAEDAKKIIASNPPQRDVDIVKPEDLVKE